MKVATLIAFTIFNLSHWYWGIFSDYSFTVSQSFGWAVLLVLYFIINILIFESAFNDGDM